MFRCLATFSNVVFGEQQLSKGEFSSLGYICIPHAAPGLLADHFVTPLMAAFQFHGYLKPISMQMTASIDGATISTSSWAPVLKWDKLLLEWALLSLSF